jgi:hypothetical protein
LFVVWVGVGEVGTVLAEEAGQVQMKIPAAAAAAVVLVGLVPARVQLVVVALVPAAVARVDEGRVELDVEARMSSYRGLC